MISSISISIGSTSVQQWSLDDLFVDGHIDEPVTFQFDADDPIIASAIAEKPKNLSADFLSKIWHIKHEEASKALEQTTVLCHQGADNTLSRKCSTNDRML